MKNLLTQGIIIAAAATLLAVGTVGVFAQAGADKAAIVKARRDFMKEQQAAFNAISAFAKGTGDREAAIAGSNKLLELSSKIDAKFIDTYFPAGTSSADLPGQTNAKPELWQHIDEAKTAGPKLHEAEVKLAEVVKTGDAKTVGDTATATYRSSCNALCHDQFRLPLQR
ncbi:MAG TPA: cytochrome c [Stellaceae bacterium]|jgi:cytochrome c556|nr:cytochrome c [Stellaceae bacterium]